MRLVKLADYPSTINKQFILAGISEISSTFKNLKNTRMLVLVMSPCNSLVQVLQKPGDFWRMIVHCHKFKQLVVLIAAASGWW